MASRLGTSALDTAAAQLRASVLAAPEGHLLGSEDDLLATLGVGRGTLKQAARLLEREGLLRVRRGVNGGYYGARPDERTIENAVSAYLNTLDMKVTDVPAVTSILWFEVVRRAARLRNEAVRTVADRFCALIAATPSDAVFARVREIEVGSRDAIFALVDCPYIKLIFDINAAFGHKIARNTSALDGTPEHLKFVQDWRRFKPLELEAIADGDAHLAAVAARNVRRVWNRRIYGSDGELALYLE